MTVMSPENVKNMVKSELETYDADKTGRTDYALESSGSALFNDIFLCVYFLFSYIRYINQRPRSYGLIVSCIKIGQEGDL